MKSFLNLLSILALIVTAVFISHPILATSYTWNASSGFWSTGTNWSPNGIPGPEDNVIISGGICTLDASVAVNSLSISNGTLDGNFDITLADALNCAGGTFQAPELLQSTDRLFLQIPIPLFSPEYYI